MQSAGLINDESPAAMKGQQEDRREHPWPGLAPYLEAEGDTFFGRDREADDLLRRVRREVLTVLFGPSGTGKTSLINAGLFSRLRQKRFLPVPIRLSLDHITLSDAGTTIVDQVKSRLQEVVAEYGLEIDSLAEPAVTDREETLWEYFHRIELWDAQNQPITPVLVFDQFEEIFTLGHNLPEVKLFLTELADLVENHIPQKVRRRMAREAEKLKFPYANQHYRIVLALREDFVAHLDNLQREMPAVMHNRLALKHMNGEQAIEAVLGPGKEIVDTPTARQIVRFVGAAGNNQQALEELEIEPALLNVVCRELNLRRLTDRSEQITTALLSGSQEAILADFYERSIADLGTEVRIFIEDDLLTASGYRDNMALEDVYQKYSIAADTIACLVDRRLLRMEERLRIQRVELIHDLLTGVAQQSRDRRQEREQQERERRQARDLHRKLRRSRLVMLAFAGITICAVYFLVLMVSSRSQVAKSAEELLYNGIIRKARISVSENPRISLLLAMEAYAAYRGQKGRLAATAEETLRDIVARVSGKALAWAPGSAAQTEKTPVRVIRFSADGRWLGGAGGRLGLVWDTGDESRSRPPILLKGNQAEILALEFHPRKPWVATAGRDHRIRIWNLEKGAAGRLQTVLRGNASTVFSIAFSPDGRWLASAGGDKTVRLWAIAAEGQPKLLHVLQGHNGLVTKLAISPGSRWLATAGLDQGVLLWPLDSGRQRLVPQRLGRVKTPVRALAFDPDERWLLVVHENDSLVLWDLSAQPTAQLIDSKIRAAAFGPEGKRLVIMRPDHKVDFWDLSRSGFEWTAPEHAPSLEGPVKVNPVVAFDPHLKWLATSGVDNLLLLWRIDTAQQNQKIASINQNRPHELPGIEGGISSLAFNRQGTRLAAAGGDQTLRYWDLSDRTAPSQPVQLRGHEGGITALSFGLDIQTLFSGSEDRTVRQWDLSQPYSQHASRVIRGHSGAVTAIAQAPKGDLLATAGATDPPRLWDLSRSGFAERPVEIATNMADVQSCIASSKRGWYACRAKGWKSWLLNGDLLTPTQQLGQTEVGKSAGGISSTGDSVTFGNTAATVHAVPLHTAGMQIRKLFFSPDEKWLAAVGWRSEFYLRRIDKQQGIGNWHWLKSHRSIAETATFSPRSGWLLTQDVAGEARLWRLNQADFENRSYALSIPGRREPLGVHAFSSDDRWLLTVATSKAVRLWYLAEGIPEKRLPAGSLSMRPPTAAGFSPDGRWLVTGHENRDLHLWRVHRDEIVHAHRIGQPPRQIGHILFSPNSRQLAVIGESGGITLWTGFERPGSESVSLLAKMGPLKAVVFSPDGNWLRAVNQADQVRLIRLGLQPDQGAGIMAGGEDWVSADFSPDSRWMTVFNLQGDFGIVDLKTHTAGDESAQAPQPHWVWPSTAPLRAGFFDHRANSLYSVDARGMLQQWNLNQHRPWAIATVLPGNYEAISGLAFHRNGDQLAVEDAHAVQYLDMVNSRKERRYPLHKAWAHDKATVRLQFQKAPEQQPSSAQPAEAIYKVVTVQRMIKESVLPEQSPPSLAPFAFINKTFSWVQSIGKKATSPIQSGGKPVGGVRQIGSALEAFLHTIGTYHNQDAEIVWDRAGTRAVSLIQGKTVQIYDVISTDTYLRRDKPIEYENAGMVTTVSLSAAGRYLAIGFKTGAVGLLDIHKSRDKSDIVFVGRHENSAAVTAMRFSRDGRWLATGCDGGEIMVWPVDVESMVQTACQRAGRGMTPGEWFTYFKDKPYGTVCASTGRRGDELGR